MNKAKVWYLKTDGELNSISVKVEQGFEIHDGYVRIKSLEDGETAAEILPMHRILSIEEYR